MVLSDNSLLKAADIIRSGGLAKKNLCADEGHCVLGAFVRAYGLNPRSYFYNDTSLAVTWITTNQKASQEMSVLADVIRKLYSDRLDAASSSSPDYFVVFKFNDHYKTTEDDVVRVLRVAGLELLSV